MMIYSKSLQMALLSFFQLVRSLPKKKSFNVDNVLLLNHSLSATFSETHKRNEK